jgi:hypothetical protein
VEEVRLIAGKDDADRVLGRRRVRIVYFKMELIDSVEQGPRERMSFGSPVGVATGKVVASSMTVYRPVEAAARPRRIGKRRTRSLLASFVQGIPHRGHKRADWNTDTDPLIAFTQTIPLRADQPSANALGGLALTCRRRATPKARST